MVTISLLPMTLRSSNNYDTDALETQKGHPDRVSKIKKLFEIQIWTIDDVAFFLDQAKGTIYNKVAKNEIPHYQKGKRGALYFIPSEILEWIKEGE